ncbi:hypothetical protein SAMN06265360_1017 [Haloechinothrix alba]|uniref:UDP-N-acetylglucosamine:LPS N-acetylglucosamine transferase n=1 Tax=Haloechinothrix alba TaxID=664784 RepID=A0A238UYJ2_9PSEU|nr:hypothetical protein SAMN06265360_1017 [Haloechinothrix alba]
MSRTAPLLWRVVTDPDRPRVILATSNGTGMGHLARAAATALACEDVEPIVFSLSQALPLVGRFGIRGEYCPGRRRTGMADSPWQHYLAARIQALVTETGARAFAFDGAWPYAGVQVARARLPHVAFTWMRRGMWQPGVNRAALDQRSLFDHVLEPGELAHPADRGATRELGDATRVSPITLLEQVDRLPREAAAGRLGLDPDMPTALVTLRTTEPGSAEARAEADAAGAAVRAVLADPDWQVAVTSTTISPGELGVRSDRLTTLRGVFPLARYLAAVDAAVVEAGYNSFHEVLLAGLPAVIVPTRAAVTDDQTGRARWAAEEGFALHAREDDPDQVSALTGELLRPGTRERLAERCAELPAPRGASETATALAGLAGTFTRHRPGLGERARTARLHLRPAVTRAASLLPGGLGARLTGTPPEAPEVTEDLERIDTDIEHILPGTSDRYRRARLRIVARFYRDGA